MAVNVGDLFARLGLDVSQFKTGAEQAMAIARATGATILDSTGKPIAQTTETTKKLGDTLKDTASGPGLAFTSLLGNIKGSLTAALGPFAGVAMAAGGIGVALGAVALTTVKAVGAFTAFATQVRDLSYISGGSAKDVSALVAGLEAFGVSSETVELGVAKMSAAIEAGSPALNRLGVSSRTSSGQLKDGLTMFYETVDALGSMTNEVERNALAREIFGRGWTSIMPILRLGSAEIRRMGEESGKAVTAEDIQLMKEYQIALHELGESFHVLAINLGAALVPALTRFIEFLTPAKAKLAELNYTAADLAANLGAISGVGGRGSATSGGTSDVGAWREGKAGVTVSPAAKIAPENLDELEKRLKLEEQLASLNVAAQSATAYTIESQLAPAIAKVNAEKQKTLNLIELEYKGGKFGVMGDPKALKDKADLEVSVTRAANAEIARLKHDSTDKIGRATQALVLKDQARLADEESIQQSIQLQDNLEAQEANQKKIADLTEYYRGEKANEDSAEERRRREILTAGADFDDTLNQMRVEDYIVTQAQIDQARKEALERKKRDNALSVDSLKRNYDDDVTAAANAWIIKTKVYEDEGRKTLASQSNLFSTIKRLYDDDVTAAINAELLKHNLYTDESRKQLDIAAGTYDALQARRDQDFRNLATYYLMIAERDHSMWAAIQSGALTTHASLGSFWGNVSKGFADTFTNINKTLSDTFFDVLTGKVSDLTTVFKNFGLSMVRVFADILAAEATKGILNLFLPSSMPGLVSGGTTAAAAAVNAAGGGAVGGTGSGGGLLGGVTNLVTGLQKLYAVATGAAEGGVLGGIDSLLGVTNLVNTLTGGTATAGTFGGLFGAASTGGVGFLEGAGSIGTGLVAEFGAPAATTAVAAGTAAGIAGTAAASTSASAISSAAGIATIPLLMVSGLRLAFPDPSDKLMVQASEKGVEYFTTHLDRAAAIAANPFAPWPEYTQGYLPGQAGNDPIYATIAGFSYMPDTGTLGKLKAQFYANFPTSDWWDVVARILEKVDPTLYESQVHPTVYDTGRAYGGPVGPGYSGPIGERGPEWLDIGQGGYGYVTPSSDTAGGSPININIDMRNSIVPERIPDAMTRKILAALRGKGVAMPGTNLLPARR